MLCVINLVRYQLRMQNNFQAPITFFLADCPSKKIRYFGPQKILAAFGRDLNHF